MLLAIGVLLFVGLFSGNSVCILTHTLTHTHTHMQIWGYIYLRNIHIYIHHINICLKFTIQSLETNQIVLNFSKGQLVQVDVTFHQIYFFN